MFGSCGGTVRASVVDESGGFVTATGHAQWVVQPSDDLEKRGQDFRCGRRCRHGRQCDGSAQARRITDLPKTAPIVPIIIQRPTREAGSAENRKVAAKAADAAVTIRIRSQTRDSADATRGGARRREADEGRHQRDRREWQTHWTELGKRVSGSCDGAERRGVYRSGISSRRPYSLWLERRRAGENYPLPVSRSISRNSARGSRRSNARIPDARLSISD
jgi:hypothetical protein